MKRLLLLSILAATISAWADTQPMTVLDPDYFGDSTGFPQQGIRVLNPDYFSSTEGLLYDARPGDFGCVSVSASTNKGQSALIGRTVKKYCESPAQITWIPKTYGPTPMASLPAGGYSTPYSNQIKGSYQICCERKGGRLRRKIGERP